MCGRAPRHRLEHFRQIVHPALDFFFRPRLARMRFKPLPVGQAQQNNVEAIAVPRNQAGGVEQLLEHLVVRSEAHLAADSQLFHPERERRLHRLSSESRSDDDGLFLFAPSGNPRLLNQLGRDVKFRDATLQVGGYLLENGDIASKQVLDRAAVEQVLAVIAID